MAQGHAVLSLWVLGPGAAGCQGRFTSKSSGIPRMVCTHGTGCQSVFHQVSKPCRKPAILLGHVTWICKLSHAMPLRCSAIVSQSTCYTNPLAVPSTPEQLLPRIPCIPVQGLSSWLGITNSWPLMTNTDDVTMQLVIEDSFSGQAGIELPREGAEIQSLV